MLPRLDLRHNQWQLITSLLMQIMYRHLPTDTPNRLIGEIVPDIEEALRIGGYEVVNDEVRRQMKLPPRDDHGWTTEELIAYEKFRLEMMFKPVLMVAPEGVEDEKGPILPTGFIYMSQRTKNQRRLASRKKRTNEPQTAQRISEQA